QWPKGALEAIKAELARQGSTDVSANRAALKLLCIRAEILTGLSSPAEDQPLRREDQVQRLLQSMGQGISPDEAQLDAIAIEWIGAGPVEAAEYLPLLERFRRCRQLGKVARATA